jgi:hypothetical protein
MDFFPAVPSGELTGHPMQRGGGTVGEAKAAYACAAPRFCVESRD